MSLQAHLSTTGDYDPIDARCPALNCHVLLTPVQLAVMEKKVEAVVALLVGLSEHQIVALVSAQVSKLNQVKCYVDSRHLFVGVFRN